MRSALKPAIESLNTALDMLEVAVMNSTPRPPALAAVAQEPQLDLSIRDEREVNRKVANRLDRMIERLETLLTEEG